MRHYTAKSQALPCMTTLASALHDVLRAGCVDLHAGRGGEARRRQRPGQSQSAVERHVLAIPARVTGVPLLRSRRRKLWVTYPELYKTGLGKSLLADYSPRNHHLHLSSSTRIPDYPDPSTLSSVTQRYLRWNRRRRFASPTFRGHPPPPRRVHRSGRLRDHLRRLSRTSYNPRRRLRDLRSIHHGS